MAIDPMRSWKSADSLRIVGQILLEFWLALYSYKLRLPGLLVFTNWMWDHISSKVITVPFQKMFTSWFLSLDTVNEYDLISLHLNGLLSMHQVMISSDFFRAIAAFVDSEFDVFRFGWCELDPVVKEPI